MSSLMGGGLGGGLSRGLGGGLSGALRSFAFREEPSDPFEGLEEWQLLERAGAPEAEVERARLEAQTIGPRGVIPLAQQIGVEPPDEKKGIITSFFDVMQRPQAAVTGFVTGLLGLERERVTADEGELLPDRNRTVEGGLGLAFERFVKGLSGEEQYRAADFGVLAYDRENAGLGERFVKSAAGFVLDVALDPITYMSMGGSIFGRVRGAQRVFGAAMTKNRAEVLSLVDKMHVNDVLKIIENTPGRYGASVSKIGATLQQRGVAGVTGKSSMETILKVLRANPAMQREIAGDMVAANMGMAYRGGSSWGLKGYLKDQFGDAGDDLYRMLPPDIQGGIRMRVPFSALGGKDPKVLFRLPGTERLSALTNGMRDYMRNTIPMVRSLGKETAGGVGLSDKRLASAYYRMQHETGRKVYGEWVPETGTIGWLDIQDTQKVFREVDDDITEFTGTIFNIYKKATKSISIGRKAAENAGVNFDEVFDKALNARVSGRLDESGKFIEANQSITEVFGQNYTEVEQAAYQAAVDMQAILQLVKDRAEFVWDGSLGGKRLFEALGEEGEYWPRVVDAMNEMLQAGPKRKGGKRPAFLFDRNRYFSFLNMDGTVGGYLTPLQVKQKYGEEVFQVAPEKVMMAYMTAVTRAMRDEQLTKSLIANGVAFRGTQVTELNVDAVMKAAVDVRNNMRLRQAAIAGIDTVTNPIDANRVFDAVRGWRGIGPRVYTRYTQVPQVADPNVAEAFRSLDNTTIERLASDVPAFRVVSPEGKYLSESGQWVSDPDAARLFGKQTDAQATADNVMSEARAIDYQDTAQELLDEFKSVIADDLARLDELNPFHHANFPTGRDAQDEYVAAVVGIIGQYANVKPSSFRSRPIVGAQYKELTSRSGLRQLGARTEEQTQVRGNLVARWNDLGLLTPAALVDDVQRLASIRESGGKFRRWLDDYYIPFYAVQKSLMTSQRGPGYVFRNIAGGVWNAYLFGVSGKHWKGSSVALIARNQAWANAKREFPDAPLSQADFATREFERILKERLGDKAGKEMFDNYQAFDRLQLGGRSIRARELGIRATELDRDIPEDVRRALLEGDRSKLDYDNVTDYLANRNRWAQFMQRQATESEDYLRFAAFLRGVDDFGLGDGGHLAAMYVRASQFDYTDLTRFEREVLKMVMPFYTWARNNIPLQARALISEPGKVMKVLRFNEAMRDAFGEPGDEGEPLPVWLRANMSWQIRRDLVKGPGGDALTMGVLVGEPLVDINRMFGTPTEGLSNVVNWREAINSINPAFNTAVSASQGLELATGGRLPQTEPAPPWAEWFRLGTVTPDGERVMSARLLRVLRDTIAPFGQAERLLPQFFGNERYQRRVLSSWASTLFGVPVSTLDPYQVGGELRAQQVAMQSELRRTLGEDWDLYTGFVRMLVDRGATANDMQIIREAVLGLGPNDSIASLPVERIDYTAARQTLDFLRRMESLQELGVPEETLRQLWENFEPQTDAERGVYAGKPQPLTEEQLAQYGLTPADIENMSPSQVREFLASVG